MSTQLQWRRGEHGAVVDLMNARMALTVIPELGGKITSCRDLVTGREWLWTNPHLAQRLPVYGASYVAEFDTGGWDEIFPSVSPCRIRRDGREIDVPDHGDLWGVPWMVAEEKEAIDGEAVLRLEAECRSLPCRFQRTIQLHPFRAEAILQYRLMNPSTQRCPFLWCAHPLVALEPGMTIQLPLQSPMQVDGVAGDLDLPRGICFAWPQVGQCDFSRVPEAGSVGDGVAAKVFTPAGTSTTARVRAADGSGLALTLCGEPSRYVGLWINYRAWSGCGSAPYLNLGLEPASAPCDSLADAVAAGQALWLEPQAEMSWQIRLNLESS